ncbi:MAG: DNA adenine methylase [Nitrospira sp. LK70]|nr:DNA adenine methylase [Nitrospira sp. LK70]
MSTISKIHILLTPLRYPGGKRKLAPFIHNLLAKDGKQIELFIEPFVGGGAMDTLIEVARKRGRPRDVAIFLILRFTGMRRESVATLQARHLDALWGLRRVRVKGWSDTRRSIT